MPVAGWLDGEARAMMSVSGLSLETATSRMGLRIECVVVVCEMREFMEVRAETSCVVRVGEGFMASAVSWEEVDWVAREVMARGASVLTIVSVAA